MFLLKEVPNYRCKDCIYYKCNADLESIENTCKRIDHKKVKFAVPWFSTYTCDYGTVCNSFIPKNRKKFNFNRYVYLCRIQWGSYKSNSYVGFTLHNDTQVRYYVPLQGFIDGTHIRNGVLRAAFKQYYKRVKTTKQNPTEYVLMRDEIQGGIKIE